MASDSDNSAKKRWNDLIIDPHHWRNSFTTQEKASGVEYANEIDSYARQRAGDFPLALRSRLLGYLKQPRAEGRAALSNELTAFILQATHDSYEREAEDAPDLHERAAFFYMTTNGALTLLRDAVKGGSDKANELGSLLTETAGKLAWQLPLIEEDPLKKMIFSNGAMRAANRVKTDYYSTRLMQFTEILYQKKRVFDFLKKKDEILDSANVKEANDGLTDSIKFLQRYMPKQCVAPALPGQETKEWLITEPLDSWDTIPLHPSHGLMIGVFGSRESIDTSMTTSHTEEEGGARITAINGVADRDLTVEIGLGRDGHLYALTGQRIVDYLPQEHRDSYEQLRAEVLCIYHDSVVPVYVTELVEQELAMQESGRNIVGHEIKDPSEKLRRLVLARKLIADTLRSEITHELENPKKDVIHRDMINHQVIGHIRRLPRSFRASQAARDMCMEDMGVVLEEFGETYVKKHERGKLENRAKGHKAVFTAGKIAMANKKEN